MKQEISALKNAQDKLRKNKFFNKDIFKLAMQNNDLVSSTVGNGIDAVFNPIRQEKQKDDEEEKEEEKQSVAVDANGIPLRNQAPDSDDSDAEPADPDAAFRVNGSMKHAEKRKRKIRQQNRNFLMKEMIEKFKEEGDGDDEEIQAEETEKPKVNKKKNGVSSGGEAIFDSDDDDDKKKRKKKQKEEIEIVPELKYDDYDADALAEMRILAQKMLR
mmetsp:Transcript_11548/g.10003  ORF Transcript_11548/g.10003 Transcript_11548/m.10003 type:complete len:216 (+) Transcript_11548:203-850(+)